MPKIQLTSPSGDIRVIEVSEMPDEFQLSEISRQIFGDKAASDAASLSLAGAASEADTKSRLPILGKVQEGLRQKAPEASEMERLRDIQEERERPGILEGIATTARSGKREIGQLLELGATVAKNPIQTSKAIVKGVKNLKKEDVKDFGIEMAKDFGKTFGYDAERPGVGFDKFDIDTAIERVTNNPISALGDIMIFGQLAKLTGKLAGKASKKIAMKKAVERSGSEIKDAAAKFAEAKAKAIARGAQVETITRGQAVALKADTLKKILKQPGGARALDSADFPLKKSVELSDRLISIGKKEAGKMNKALSKVSNQKVDTLDLSNAVKKNLEADGFASAKSAVDAAIEGAKGADEINIIKDLNKSKLVKFVDNLETGKSMSVKELKNVLDSIDDSINYIKPKASDDGLKVLRRAIRKELGRVSPEYDKIASRIHDRLTELGYVENKLKRAAKEGFLRNYKEKLGLEIAKSNERAKSFENAMRAVGDETAGAAVGKLDLIDSWRVWNDLYGQNQNVFKFAGDARDRMIDSLITGGRKLVRRRVPQFDLPTAARGLGEDIGIAGGRVRRTVPIASTLTEGLLEKNR